MMSMRLMPCIAAALCAACAIPAQAELRVLTTGGTPIPKGAATVTYNFASGGFDVTLHELFNPGGETVYEIRGSGAEIIDNLLIDVDGPPAGSPLIVKLLSEAPGSLRTVRNILQTGNAETLLLKVNVTEDIGFVSAEVIGELICGRDMLGPIISTTADNATRGISWAQANRDILGDVMAENGRIGLVWAQRNIGTAGAPIDIAAKHKITQVMGKDIHADINSRVNGGTGGFWAMVADRFFGTLTTEQLYFNTSNGIDGLIQISQQFTGRINIGKNLVSPAQYIQVPVGGLGGQVIVNYDSVPGGNWTSPVRVGPNGNPGQIVIIGPKYPHTVSQLGGGAVGLVPFKLHEQSCLPANNQIVQSSSPTIKLRHYGPIMWEAALGLPVTIERRLAGSSSAYTAAPIGDLIATHNLVEPTVVTVSTAPGKPGFAPGFQYRIRPKIFLKCAVPAQPSVLWDADYLVTVQPGQACLGDVNGNGIVNVDDLLAVINAWGSTTPGHAADVTGNGVINVDDLLAVINAWGSC